MSSSKQGDLLILPTAAETLLIHFALPCQPHYERCRFLCPLRLVLHPELGDRCSPLLLQGGAYPRGHEVAGVEDGPQAHLSRLLSCPAHSHVAAETEETPQANRHLPLLPSYPCRCHDRHRHFVLPCSVAYAKSTNGRNFNKMQKIALVWAHTTC